MSETNNPTEILGANIQARRMAKGLKQRELARKLEIQQATWHKIEKGERLPTAEQAQVIAKFFDYELTELHLTMPAKYPAPAFTPPATVVGEAA